MSGILGNFTKYIPTDFPQPIRRKHRSGEREITTSDVGLDGIFEGTMRGTPRKRALFGPNYSVSVSSVSDVEEAHRQTYFQREPGLRGWTSLMCWRAYRRKQRISVSEISESGYGGSRKSVAPLRSPSPCLNLDILSSDESAGPGDVSDVPICISDASNTPSNLNHVLLDDDLPTAVCTADRQQDIRICDVPPEVQVVDLQISVAPSAVRMGEQLPLVPSDDSQWIVCALWMYPRRSG